MISPTISYELWCTLPGASSKILIWVPPEACILYPEVKTLADQLSLSFPANTYEVVRVLTYTSVQKLSIRSDIEAQSSSELLVSSPFNPEVPS